MNHRDRHGREAGSRMVSRCLGKGKMVDLGANPDKLAIQLKHCC